NEAFNEAPAFAANQWLRSLPGSDVPSLAAQQATQAFGIWSQVFADRPGQLLRVAAGFNGGSFYNHPFLAAMDQRGPNFDAFAVAPYFGNLDAVASYSASTTVDQVLSDVTASIAPTLNDLRTAKDLADQYHVRFVAYEGGPSVQSPPGTPQAVETVLSQ